MDNCGIDPTCDPGAGDFGTFDNSCGPVRSFATSGPRPAGPPDRFGFQVDRRGKAILAVLGLCLAALVGAFGLSSGFDLQPQRQVISLPDFGPQPPAFTFAPIPKWVSESQNHKSI